MKSNKLIKYLVISTVVIVIIAVIAKQKGWVGQKDVVQVSVEKVSKKSIVETVAANGKVQPEVEVKISPDVSGEVVELFVKEGDHVKAGQLLAKVDPIIYASNLERMVAGLNTTKANLANAKARLAQSESQFIKAEANYKRNKKLADDGTISASDFENIKSAYEVALAEVEAAKQNVLASDYNVKSGEASLKEAKDNLMKTSIFAPVNGTVSKLNIEKGERVVGTSQMAGTEMMRIANLNEMEVAVDVNENDIVRVHLGDTAIVDVDSYQGTKFKGVVTEIANSANVTGMSTDQATNFPVKIRILRSSYESLLKEKQGSPFRPGMSATVDIETKKVSNVSVVPIQAVTTRDTAKAKEKPKKDSGKPGESKKEVKEDVKITECVFVVTDGKVQMRTVTTGIQDNTYIEIKSGLKDGDEVITGPYSAISKKLKNDDPVKIVSKEELFKEEKD